MRFTILSLDTGDDGMEMNKTYGDKLVKPKSSAFYKSRARWSKVMRKENKLYKKANKSSPHGEHCFKNTS